MAGNGMYQCPECGERAVNKPPRNRMYRTDPHGRPVKWSHVDGEPLCPVMGSKGYEAAQPVSGGGR